MKRYSLAGSLLQRSGKRVNPILVLLFCALCACRSPIPSDLFANTTDIHPVAGESAVPYPNNYGKLPLYFEANQGQAPTKVKFISRGHGYTVFLDSSAVILGFNRIGRDNAAQIFAKGHVAHEVRMRLVGANDNARMIGERQQPGRVNYLVGRKRYNWHTNVPVFEEIIARDVYPGIDLRYHGDQQRLEYDFIVSPGSDTDMIRLSFSGVEDIRIDGDGDMLLETMAGTLTHKKPVIYQEINGTRKSVDGAYRVIQDRERVADGVTEIGFQIAPYDPGHTLVIDPVLDYSTYYGGGRDDAGLAIAVDGDGNSYIAGATASIDLFTDPTLQYQLAGQQDNFIVKLSADGSQLLYATYFGGTGLKSINYQDEDEGGDGCEESDDWDDDSDDENEEGILWDADSERVNAITVNTEGELVVTGHTNSNRDFPLVNPVQAEYGGGCSDAYVAQLNSEGSAFISSTYLGGLNRDEGVAVAVDADGSIVMAGTSSSYDYPTLNSMQNSILGRQDVVITKLDIDSGNILFSTYFGGSRRDRVAAMDIEQDGSIVMIGETRSRDYPVTTDAMQRRLGGEYLGRENDNREGEDDKQGNGDMDAFITRITNDGQQIRYSTFLGGDANDSGTGLALDPGGRLIISGNTNSRRGLPVTDNALQAQYAGGRRDGFISILDSISDTPLYTSYFGGSGEDRISGIAVDGAGFIYVTGETRSKTDFPLHDPLQGPSAEYDGDEDSDDEPGDAFIANLSPDGGEIIYSTYFGGSGMDRGTAIAAGISGNVHVTGLTKSGDFPLHRPIQSVNGGHADAFILKIKTLNHAPVITSVPITSGRVNFPYVYQVIAGDEDSDTLIYRLVTAPEGMTMNESTGLVIWEQPVTGSHDIEIEVTDRRAFVRQAYTLVTNVPPIIISTPPLLATLNHLYNYSVDATDPDGDTISYSLDIAPAGMEVNRFSSSRGNFIFIRWTPTERGDFDIVLRVTDSHGAYATQAFTINVPNTVPVILSTPGTFGLAGEAYTYQVLAQDAESDGLRYSLTDSPAGMAMDPLTGLITWASPFKGVSNVTLEVNDGHGGSVTQSYSIAVPNRSPVITSSPVTEVEFDTTYSYNVTAADPDGDLLIYALVNSPAGMTIDAATGVITWQPDSGANVVVEVRVEDDDQAGATQLYYLTVRRPPEILSTPMTLGFQDQLYPYDVDATDPEDHPLFYKLSQAPDGMAINPESGAISWRPGVSGDFQIEVTVTNNQGDAAGQAFTLKILAENDILIVSDPETEGFVGEPYQYSVSVLGQHTENLTYTLTSAPIGMTINGTGVIEWIPDSAGSYQVQVDVSNDGGNSDGQMFNINIRSLEEMDNLFRAIWDAIFQNLIDGNKQGALSYLTISAQSKYERVFDILMFDMQSIKDNLSPIQKTHITPNIAEYIVRKTTNGEERFHLIYFMLDENGDWRIHTM